MNNCGRGQPWPFRVACALALLALLMTACGGSDDGKKAVQQSFKVGVLNPLELFAPLVEGFKDGMAALGYVEGQNITYIYDGPVGNSEEELQAYVRTLAEQKVDLILTIATPATRAAQQMAGNTPIIFVLVVDPVGAGFVQSRAHPGGNLTGVSYANPDPRRLQLLKEILPDMKRVYVPLDTNIQSVRSALAEVQAVVDDLGIELVLREVHTPDDVRQAMAEIPDDVDLVFTLPDVTTIEFVAEFAAAAMARGIPFSPPINPHTENVLLSHGVDYYPSGKQAARLAAQVLRGTNPGDLPVELPEPSLMVNLQVAEALGVTVPDAILVQADTIVRAPVQ